MPDENINIEEEIDPSLLTIKIVSVKWECPKGHIWMLGADWNFVYFNDFKGQREETGPICPTCMVNFLKDNVPTMTLRKE